MWIWLCFFQKPERRGNEEIELVFVEKYVRGESLKRKMARSGSEAFSLECLA